MGRPALALALLAFAAPASAAPVATGVTRLGANPVTALAFWSAAPGAVTVGTDGGRRRQYPIPVGCSPTAITTGKVGLTCAAPEAPVQLLRLADRTVRPVEVDGVPGVLDAVEAVGRRWARVRYTECSPYVPRCANAAALVRLSDGRTVDLVEDPFGAQSALDLDRHRPARPLCAGARRRRAGGMVEASRFWPVTAIRRWVLSPINDLRVKLYDCATHRTRELGTAGGPYYLLNADYLVRVAGSVRATRLGTGAVERFAARSAVLSAHGLWLLSDGVLRFRRLGRSP